MNKMTRPKNPQYGIYAATALDDDKQFLRYIDNSSVDAWKIPKEIKISGFYLNLRKGSAYTKKVAELMAKEYKGEFKEINFPRTLAVEWELDLIKDHLHQMGCKISHLSDEELTKILLKKLKESLV